MKIRQNVRHFASRKALETPLLRSVVASGLVRLHTKVFLERADPERADERKERLDAFFERTIDTYLRALEEGYSEAEAREITHVQANFEFYNHGWTEMMEFPASEIEDHYERHRDFFETWGITVDDPLGEFRDGMLPEAPSTPGKLENPEHPHAQDGFADDVYVEGPDGELTVGGRDEPDDLDVSRAVGVDREGLEDE